eukprot:Sspe_Gene.48622::Locus_25477_Transcript_3_9_Confidence_0.333_Length_1340::g.48622::m.48622/K09936/TC.BAT2; bacterial/archaeal transporter family-2 protein
MGFRDAVKHFGVYALPILAGFLTVLQAGVNTKTGKVVFNGVTGAPLRAAFLNFAVGFVCVLLAATIHKPKWEGTRLREAPWYSLTGGVCGACYVSLSIFLSVELGAALYFLMATGGCLLFSIIIDIIGPLNLKKQLPTRLKILGIVFLVAGSAMMQDYGGGDMPAWKKVLFCLLSFLGGGLNPVQAVLNRSVVDYVLTPYRGAVISFGGGAAVLLIASAITLSQAPLEVHGGEPWMWMGGLIGSVFVTSAIIGVPIIGAGWYYCFMIGAQLVTAFFFDTFALVGYEEEEVTVLRVVGLLCAVFGVALYSWPTKRVPMATEPIADEVQNDSHSNTMDIEVVKEGDGDHNCEREKAEESRAPAPEA